jgi:phage tail sheath gpL-like
VNRIIASNLRAPGSYTTIDESGANTGIPVYSQPIQIVAPRIKAPAAAWAAATAYALGVTIMPTSGHNDGHYYICIVAGTSGGTEPTWPGAGGTVTDGSTLVWREMIYAAEIKNVEIPVRIYSVEEAALYAGAGSLAHRMARAAIRQYRDSEIYLNLVDDASSGVKATSTIVFAGTAVGQGTAALRNGNELIAISWADGDTSAEVATALDAAIAALHDLPVTPSVAAGTVTIWAKNAGTPGNEIGLYDIDDEDWQPVITITGDGITATITGFANGANNPDITDALAASVSGAFSLIAIPYKDATNITALRAHMLSVSDEINQNGARGFVATTDTIAAASTLAQENDSRLHVAIVRRCRFTSFEIAAAAAAMHAQTGHPGVPLNTMEMVDCDAPDPAARFSQLELNSLLWAGVTPYNADGFGAVRCIRSITTYTANSTGSPDPFWLDTTTVACFDFVRKAIRTAHLLRFSQAVLRQNHADGEPSFVVTPADIASLNFAICKELERYGVVQQVDLYKSRFISVRDADVAGRVNSDIPVEVVQGLHILANYIRVVSSVGSGA